MNAKAEDHGNKTHRLFFTGDVGKKKTNSTTCPVAKKGGRTPRRTQSREGDTLVF